MGNFINYCYSKHEPNQSNQKIPTEEELTISKLRDFRDQLVVKRRELEKQIEICDKQIKEKIKQNQKDTAKIFIQRKQLFETQYSLIQSKSIFIQKSILDIDMAVQDKQLNSVLKETNNLIKNIQQSIDIDVFDDLKVNKDQQLQINQLYKEYQVENQEGIDQEFLKYEQDIKENQSLNNQQQIKIQTEIQIESKQQEKLQLQEEQIKQEKKQQQIAMLE